MRDAKSVIAIAHHPDAQSFGAINVLDPKAAATAQLVWGLAKALLEHPNADIALCCYLGLVTDTGRFSYDNTCVSAFMDAAPVRQETVKISGLTSLRSLPSIFSVWPMSKSFRSAKTRRP